MKISAFQIKNYRSIVDSKKCYLSPDCITALIGQNESGKTSVLEALRSFYEGVITDDVLRSDLTFPEITCTFLSDEGKTLADYIDLSALPSEIKDDVSSRKEISLTRRWINARQNKIFIAVDEITDFYKTLETNKSVSTDKIIASIAELTRQTETGDQGAEPALSVCRLFRDQSLRLKAIIDEQKVTKEALRIAEYHYNRCKSSREARNYSKRIERLRVVDARLSDEHTNLTIELSKNMKIADKLLSGMEITEAEREANTEYETESRYPTLEEMGSDMFRHIPVFEFFEDFSSLLPNKIDLEDLLNENTYTEGYKAARNFIYVAGLNADFFREENHRILKQKIENLNTGITVDFQDYWRQSVGKDDKIRINFELEHYDNSQPDKSGKPYLEFWIKDKKERLYPKQRSRGVRWFLSFYLELKATAKANSVDRVMLIDEPGLSLHARAQEDVLKVFEDLRQNLQIIYCTHSPNLIDLKKLYRIIAVQRARESDETSETIILDSRSLNEASTDTLSPVYALMGTRLDDRQFIFPHNNFIVEDSVTFHYLETMSMLYGFEKPVHFIPASGSELIPIMVNLLFGWKINFGVIMMDNPVNRNLSELMNNTTFYASCNRSVKKIIIAEGFTAAEDLFSTIDFKRFVLKQRVGITVSNSEYIEANKLSRIIMVSDFQSRIREENIKFNDFDEETRSNFERLFSVIKKMSEEH